MLHVTRKYIFPYCFTLIEKKSYKVSYKTNVKCPGGIDSQRL